MNQEAKKIKSLLDEGSALHQLGKLEEAKLIYETILKISPKQFEATHLLGTLHAQIGQYSSAIALLNEAISINPKQYESHSNIGNAYFELNQFEEAVIAYNKAIKLKPSNPKDYCNKGIALHKLKKYEDSPRIVLCRSSVCANSLRCVNIALHAQLPTSHRRYSSPANSG